MPELPEVESVRRQLLGVIVGRRIVGAWADAHPSARQSAVADAVGGTITAVRRRGKFLLIPLRFTTAKRAGADRELVLHLGMTGSLRVATATDKATWHHDRAWFDFDDGARMLFGDPRRFGRIAVAANGDYTATSPTLAALVQEPLDATFDVSAFATALAATRAPVKAALLQQRIVAGIGNIYADEALWRAGIHPRARRVGSARAARLHEAIVAVLTAAIDREGTTFRDYRMVNGQSGRYASQLDVYGKAGNPCRRCGTTLRRDVIAQRGTSYCPRCQRM
ncbi:MAG: bifunctional DNA-formamidopyrimidine glycosylase/DNA-(apurinic or apyrimidinic site) lyase [Nitriliruptoraceae bacterium]